MLLGRAGIAYDILYNRFKLGGTAGDTSLEATNVNQAERQGFLCEKDFNDAEKAVGVAMKEKYGTFENYLKAQMLAYPLMVDCLGLVYGRAKEFTQVLSRYNVTVDSGNVTSATKYHDEEGVQVLNDLGSGNLSSMCNKIVQLGGSGSDLVTNSYGLNAGSWYLIGAEDLYEWLSDDYKVAKTTAAFRKIGSLSSSQTVKSSHRWVCARGNSYYCWNFTNGGGTVSSNVFAYTGESVSPVSLLELF